MKKQSGYLCPVPLTLRAEPGGGQGRGCGGSAGSERTGTEPGRHETFRRDGLRPKDIAAFLAALELPQYAGGFVANGVDFLAIPALERDDWVELGVPIGHRARIVKEHKQLHPELW